MNDVSATIKERIWKSFYSSNSGAVPDAASRDAFDSYARLMPFCAEEQDALKSYDESFLVRFTYHSAAIEGSTLSLADTALVLDGEFPSDTGNKRLRDVFMAQGIADASEWARERLAEDEPVTEEFIKNIHQRLALDCQPRTRGAYRVHPVYIRGATTVPANPLSIRDNMADLLAAYHDAGLHPVIAATAFHALFENIHPFADANGRTGRVVLNYMLMQSGYPPVALKAASSARYFAGLEAWQTRDDPADLLRLVNECLLDELAARASAVMQTRNAMAALR